MISSSPVQSIQEPTFERFGVRVAVKRDDLLHPHVMGNKWRKLKYNLKYALENDYEGILTFGGAFSNHIAATAAACNENNLKSVGYIRGDELNPSSNHTLRFASRQGMKLNFISRTQFSELRNDWERLRREFPSYYILPEGGTNYLALLGVQELIGELQHNYDYVITPIGTGGTLAGMLRGLQGNGKLLGISALKGDFVHEEFQSLLIRNDIPYNNYEIITRFHFGGYGKVTPELVDFINRTYERTGLLFDPIYTGKMYFGVTQMINEGYFTPGTRLLLVHTGGVQGIEGYNEIHEKKIRI